MTMTSKIAERGMWLSTDESDPEATHAFDERLCDALAALYQGRTVVDFGCGPGRYVEAFQAQEIECCGYDGNPNTVELSRGLCKVIDLSEPFDLGKQFDWVMSLEVGEHIPAEFEPTYIDNLVRHCKGSIVVSWALPKQGGHGHVNCLSNKEVQARFESRGMKRNKRTEKTLRRAARLDWFKKTILSFDLV